MGIEGFGGYGGRQMDVTGLGWVWMGVLELIWMA